MKCLYCKGGETKPGLVTVPLQRDGIILIVKDVPAEVCATCGEPYLAKEINAKLFELAEEAIKNCTEVAVMKYAA